MVAEVSKYFDDVFHKDDSFHLKQSCLYELNFRDKIQQWIWNGRLDRNNNRILHNFNNYASDTYLAINSDNKIVGGYSFILESGYENTAMKLIKEGR